MIQTQGLKFTPTTGPIETRKLYETMKSYCIHRQVTKKYDFLIYFDIVIVRILVLLLELGR